MSHIPVVYATGEAPIALPTGVTVHVARGQHWPKNDPVVLAAPGLFSEDPRYGILFSSVPEGYDAPVEETATAAPGERRTTRRTSAF